MFRLLGIVVSIGLADSVNPSTVAPSLYLAAGEHARDRVLKFTLGAFTAYFLGGVLIALGPGELVLALVPRPSAETRGILAIVAGCLLLAGSALLWTFRARLRNRSMPAVKPSSRSSFWLGATIMAVELPTALPYFGAIAAIVGSDYGPIRQLLLLLVFNVCFIAPELAILATLWIAGDSATARLAAVRARLGRHWPVMAAVAALIAGGIAIYLGVDELSA